MARQRSDCVELSVMKALLRLAGKTDVIDEFQIAKSEFDFHKQRSVLGFKLDYLSYSFLRKWKGLSTGIDLTKEAFNTWISAERQCFKTNRSLDLQSSTSNFDVPPSVIVTAQRKIAEVLGRFRFEDIEGLCRWSGGATFDLRRGSDIACKMASEITITSSAIPYMERILKGDNHWFDPVAERSKMLRIVRGNRVVMVPKSAKTHRTISAEPTGNSFLQQGVGRYIRQRLKRFGVDLDDQTINQDLARRALLDNLATIDLSSASDTLSIGLVKLLLPPDWYQVLSDLRSPASSFNGKWFLLSKFSSMGNAFTFELESLIFWAICTALKSSDDDVVSVYGDDLIVNSKNFESVEKSLHSLGFKVNYDKSFSSPSRFYESCGKHYFESTDVTPVYQKDVCRKPSDYIRLYNRLMRFAIRNDLITEITPCCEIVLDYYRRTHRRARVSFGPCVEFDEFFIDPTLRPGPLQDSFDVWCLMRRSKIARHTGHLERMLYAYKLRDPSFSNLDPCGISAFETGEIFLWKHKKIWVTQMVN